MAQPYVTVSIQGLKETYRINEPIKFSVNIKGVLKGGGFPRVTITKEGDTKSEIYGASFMSPEPPTAPAKYVEQNLRFPSKDDPQAPILAKDAGTYTLKILLALDGLKTHEVNKRIEIR